MPAVAYVLSGMYGDPRDLGTTTSLLLVGQLFFAGLMVLTMDDLLSKGYGLGGGINLFIATNVCESIFWRCFSPTTFNLGKGTEFEGAVIALFHMLLTRPNKLKAVQEALFRQGLPNLTNLAATVLVFLVVIYIQGFKVELPIKYQNYRGQQARQEGACASPPVSPAPCAGHLPHQAVLHVQHPHHPPLRDGRQPVPLLSGERGGYTPRVSRGSACSHLLLTPPRARALQVLFKRYGGNIFVQLLGRWKDADSGMSVPVGGLAYYVSPPRNFTDVLADPFHAVFYIVFMLSACGLFAKLWIEISGQGPKDVARQLRDQKMLIRGTREAGMVNYLNHYIPTAAAFGGMCVGALSIFADLLGAIGSGTGERSSGRRSRRARTPPTAACVPSCARHPDGCVHHLRHVGEGGARVRG